MCHGFSLRSTMRVAFYLIWQIVWGGMRLELRFGSAAGA